MAENLKTHQQKYLFLMRHGDVYRGHPDEEKEQRLSYEGWELCRTHAKILAQRFKDARINKFVISEIWTSRYVHSIGSAEEVRAAMDVEAPHIVPKPFLNPFVENPTGCLRKIERFLDAHDGLLVVGHMPLLSWLLERTTKVVATVERGEILCLMVNKKRRALNNMKPFKNITAFKNMKAFKYILCWSLSKTDKETFEKVREKIKFKMDTAKLLGGIITLGLGWILTYFLDVVKYAQLDRLQRILLGEAALLFFLSIALYIATMYHYDSLLMPVRFWGESTVKKEKIREWIVYRPPSSSTWIIYQNMIRIWNKVFMCATYFTGLAFLCLARPFSP